MSDVEVPGWFYPGRERMEALFNTHSNTLNFDLSQCPLDLACGFASLGGFMPKDAKCERAIVGRLLPKIGPFRNMIGGDTRELIGCLYECLMFSVTWRAGFAPSFLGMNHADFESKQLGLLFECKDLRGEHSLNGDMSRATRSIAQCMRDADEQLRKHDPEDKYLRISFIDLPEGTHEWLSEMSEEERTDFWGRVLLDDETGTFRAAAQRTIFTACDTLHTFGNDTSVRNLGVRIVHPMIFGPVPLKLAGVMNDLYHVFGTTPYAHLGSMNESH